MTTEAFKASGIELSNSEGMIVTKAVTMPDGKSVNVSGLKGALPGGGDFFPDVGWDYNPGDHQAAAARLESIREEKALMAKRAQKAAQAAVDKPLPEPVPEPFDTSTPAGKWHQPAWEGAPKWLRDVVVREQNINVVSVKTTATATAGHTIDTDGLQLTQPVDLSTWRHEMGHILDFKLGSQGQYVSTSPEISKAIDALGDELHQVWQLKSTQASNYNDAALAMIKSPEKAVLAAAYALGLNHVDVIDLVRTSTLLLDSSNPSDWNSPQRAAIGRLLHALKIKDVERAIALCVPDMSTRQWQVDGALVALSDLVGASTLNRVCAYQSGYYGHEDDYYAKGPDYRYTEVFANLTALAGHNKPAWWALIKHLAPDLASVYEQVVTSK
jgi:hypothetical protein